VQRTGKRTQNPPRLKSAFKASGRDGAQKDLMNMRKKNSPILKWQTSDESKPRKGVPWGGKKKRKIRPHAEGERLSGHGGEKSGQKNWTKNLKNKRERGDGGALNPSQRNVDSLKKSFGRPKGRGRSSVRMRKEETKTSILSELKGKGNRDPRAF